MKLRNNVIWGLVLIIVGLLFLGINLDYIDISFKQFVKLWPVFLIVAGLNHLFNRQTGQSSGSLTTLLIILAIPMAVASMVDKGINHVRDEIDINGGFEFDDNENSDRNYDDPSDTTSVGFTDKMYKIDFASEKTAKLDLKIGAAEIKVGTENTHLFSADAKSSKPISYKINSEKNGDNTNVDFKLNKLKWNSDSDSDRDFDQNELTLNLHTAPIWQLDMAVGAAESVFDFSKHKISDLKLKVGAADTEIVLGELQNNVDVKVESGAASLTIKIPENSGCEVDFNGVFNDKNLDGFESEGDGSYKTKNYRNAKNKIHIKVTSAISSIKIEKY